MQEEKKRERNKSKAQKFKSISTSACHEYHDSRDELSRVRLVALGSLASTVFNFTNTIRVELYHQWTFKLLKNEKLNSKLISIYIPEEYKNGLTPTQESEGSTSHSHCSIVGVSFKPIFINFQLESNSFPA